MVKTDGYSHSHRDKDRNLAYFLKTIAPRSVGLPTLSCQKIYTGQSYQDITKVYRQNWVNLCMFFIKTLRWLTMLIKNTGTDKDPSTSFYFACDYCGEPIEDLNGVVDFPSSHRSEKIKQPYRFYHKGSCAFQGDKLRQRDKWGNFSL